MTLKKLPPKIDTQEDNHFFVNTRAIKILSKLLEETGLTEIDYEQKGVRIRLSRASSRDVFSIPPAAALPVETSGTSDASNTDHGVPSPMVGTVYLTPQPGADPFIKVGDQVQEGQVLLIIEAMKIFNPIKSPVSGIVTHIAVTNGSPVEYGAELVRIQ